MEELDIQNKLDAWKQRMSKKREAEEEARRQEQEKLRQHYLQRTGRVSLPAHR